MSSPDYKKIRLKTGKDRSVRNFHPWLFSGAIAQEITGIDNGEVVEVEDSEGNYLATGHFHKGSIMVRILTFQREEINISFWKKRIRQALDLRKNLSMPENDKTNCFRLIHAEGDHIPGLVIDIYEHAAVIQAHSSGILNALNDIAAALTDISSDLQINTIYFKNPDHSGREKVDASGHLKGDAVDGIVLENGNRFYVNWAEGQKTGFFLDQRMNRELLMQYAKGRNILNTFCYSGGFSIYALRAGAKKVVSVDGSQKAIDWAKRNVALNFGETINHTAICGDVFDYFRTCNDSFDTIILDPPAFAKHISSVNKAVIGYRNLNETAIRAIKPGGIIFTFSCSQAMDKELFRKTIFSAAAKTGRQVRILHQLSQGPDHPVNLYHPEGEYLKGLVLQID